MNKNIKLGKHSVGDDHPPFVIAEMSGNHQHSLDRAFQLIDAAGTAQVHALKIQTFTADTMTLNLSQAEFVINDPKSLWHGRSLYDLYEEAHTPWDWHKPLQERCHKNGLEFFSTPFDATAVAFLEKLNVPFYKIASFENTDIPLIRAVAQTGKPVIISLGMASEAEIEDIVSLFQKEKNDQLILLKCTSAYPAKVEDANLLTIPELKKRYGVLVGLSDHTLGLAVPLAAVALGACVIEKHFTLDRNDGGVDAAFSLEPHELSLLKQESERAFKALGQVHFGPKGEEAKSLQFRRSLYITKDLPKGHVLQPGDFRAIRPGFGLSPKYADELLGKTLLKDVKTGTALSRDFLSE
ncbi:MAG: pseudaminic acid synthase [Deltaproteobacteria bacterium]|nr:pseudaminic acid synthase [Deltaproteobacteria bacterium]